MAPGNPKLFLRGPPGSNVLTMRFRKYEGLGNDFLVVDAAEAPANLDVVRAACARRFGAGADGILVVARDPYRMRVFNADGSVPEMCGNGLRCVALYIRDHLGETAERFTVETDAGPKEVLVDGDEVGVVMGAARDDGYFGVEFRAVQYAGRKVDTGNPHFVLLRDAPWEEDVFAGLGAALQDHAGFPGGVNVSFAERLAADHVNLRVWERGVGPTLACGTGACATVAAGWWSGRLEGDVTVDLPGGTLRVGGSSDWLAMTGPAHEVFSGVWPRCPSGGA